jgi:hypothetical protein
MDVCLYCDHEIIYVKGEGWQHINHNGAICLVQVKGYNCGCDCALPDKDEDE